MAQSTVFKNNKSQAIRSGIHNMDIDTHLEIPPRLSC